jgi:hypothetical protein
MHKITVAWNPINIGLVIDLVDRYFALGLFFVTYRYYYVPKGE